jgi:hypothetical protein
MSKFGKNKNTVSYISTSSKKIKWGKTLNSEFENIDSTKSVTFIDYGGVAEYSNIYDDISVDNSKQVIIISHVKMEKTGSRLIDEAIERIDSKQLIGCVAFTGDPLHKADIINEIMDENNISKAYFIDDKEKTVYHVRHKCKNVQSVVYASTNTNKTDCRINLLDFLAKI